MKSHPADLKSPTMEVSRSSGIMVVTHRHAVLWRGHATGCRASCGILESDEFLSHQGVLWLGFLDREGGDGEPSAPPRLESQDFGSCRRHSHLLSS